MGLAAQLRKFALGQSGDPAFHGFCTNLCEAFPRRSLHLPLHVSRKFRCYHFNRMED